MLKNKEYEDRLAILEADSRVMYMNLARLQRLIPTEKLEAALSAEEQELQREEQELRALEEEHMKMYGTLRGKRGAGPPV